MNARRAPGRLRRTGIALVLSCAVGAPLPAQPTARTWVPLDTVFALRVRPGCESVDTVAAQAVDAARARTLWRDAQEALIEGDRARARRLFEEATSADPREARVWLELSAIVEQQDTSAALAAVCRVLMLPTATATQQDEARRRWQRLLGEERVAQLASAERRFRDGVHAARQEQWNAARRAFDEVLGTLPSAEAAWRNRAIVSAEAGDRAAAERDLSRYVQSSPGTGAGSERLMLSRALAALRRPRFTVGATVAAGLLPGGAQFFTRRPAFGVLILSAVGASVAAAVMPRTEERLVPFLDPNGEPAPYTETYRSYPYRRAGVTAAAVLWAVGLAEGARYASRSARLPVLLSLVPHPSGDGLSLMGQVAW